MRRPKRGQRPPTPPPHDHGRLLELQCSSSDQQQKRTGMEAFREAAFRRAASDPTRPLTAERKEALDRCLLRLFPAAPTTPDHPPYAAMIHRAISELNEEGGSRKEEISNFITAEYDALPWVPSDYLTFHLVSLCESGEISRTANGRYLIPSSETDPAHVPNKTLKPSKRKRRSQWRQQQEPLYREVFPVEGTREEENKIVVHHKNSEVEKIELVGVADKRIHAVVEGSKKPRRGQWRQCREKVEPICKPRDVATSFDVVIGSLQEQEIQSDQPDRSGKVVSEIQSEVSISETPLEHNLPTQVEARVSPLSKQQWRLCKENTVPECALKDVATPLDATIGSLLRQEIESNQPNRSGKAVSDQSNIKLVGVTDERKQAVVEGSKKPRRVQLRQCSENVVTERTERDLATSFDVVPGSPREQKIQSDQPDKSGKFGSKIRSESDTPLDVNLPTQVEAKVSPLSKQPHLELQWRQQKENTVPECAPKDVATSLDVVIGSLLKQEIQSNQPEKSGKAVSDQSEVSFSETSPEINLLTQVEAEVSPLSKQPHLEQQLMQLKENMVPECAPKDVATCHDVVIGSLLKQEIQSNQPEKSRKAVSNQLEVSLSERSPESNLPTQVEANIFPFLKQPQLEKQPECTFSDKYLENKITIVDDSFQKQKQPQVCKEQIAYEPESVKVAISSKLFPVNHEQRKFQHCFQRRRLKKRFEENTPTLAKVLPSVCQFLDETKQPCHHSLMDQQESPKCETQKNDTSPWDQWPDNTQLLQHPLKRGRGRPPKRKSVTQKNEAELLLLEPQPNNQQQQPPPEQGQGRPPKRKSVTEKNEAELLLLEPQPNNQQQQPPPEQGQGRPPKRKSVTEKNEAELLLLEPQPNNQQQQPPPERGRGRPPKRKSVTEKNEAELLLLAPQPNNQQQQPPPEQGRGRPRKRKSVTEKNKAELLLLEPQPNNQQQQPPPKQGQGRPPKRKSVTEKNEAELLLLEPQPNNQQQPPPERGQGRPPKRKSVTEKNEAELLLLEPQPNNQQQQPPPERGQGRPPKRKSVTEKNEAELLLLEPQPYNQQQQPPLERGRGRPPKRKSVSEKNEAELLLLEPQPNNQQQQPPLKRGRGRPPKEKAKVDGYGVQSPPNCQHNDMQLPQE